MTGDLPLSGFRVVEISTMLAAPLTASSLAELGADVVKVEPIGGDLARRYAPSGFPDRIAPAFLAGNAGKRSIGIDLTQEGGREILSDLISHADIVVENVKPGGMHRLGIDAHAYCASNTKLIWTTLSGYGPQGPDSDRTAVDQTIQAESGVVAATGPGEGSGYRVGFHVIDHAAVHVMVAKILEKVLQQERTGLGGLIHVSLFETALSLQAQAFAEYFITEREPTRSGNASFLSAPNDVVVTSDGSLMLIAHTELQWLQLCDRLELSDLLGDSRFATGRVRVTNRIELRGEIGKVTRRLDTQEVLRLLDGTGILAASVRTYGEVATSNEVVANARLSVAVDLLATSTERCVRSTPRPGGGQSAFPV